jgi:cell division protein ZapA
VTQPAEKTAVDSREPARVSVRILEKEYAMVCPYEERSALLDSAEFLNARMREVRDSGKVVGLDRIAVMVALNLANEYLRLKNRESKLESDASVRVKNLRERVESQLAKGQQLEF